MEELTFKLPMSKYRQLTKCYRDENSANTGRRAVEIVKCCFEKSGCRVERGGQDGADLTIRCGTGKPKYIEVKGTAQEAIAADRLKVSGCPSYRALKKGRALYRVTGVFTKKPSIYVLKYPGDFDMIEEPRWRIRLHRRPS